MEVRSVAAPVRKNRYNASTGLVDYLSLASGSPVNTVHHWPADGSLTRTYRRDGRRIPSLMTPAEPPGWKRMGQTVGLLWPNTQAKSALGGESQSRFAVIGSYCCAHFHVVERHDLPRCTSLLRRD